MFVTHSGQLKELKELQDNDSDSAFAMHPSGLHYWDPTLSKGHTKGLALVETVQDRMKKYTKRQVSAAELARKGLRNAGFPSEKDFRWMVQQRQVEECPIIAEDVNRAIDIHGKDVGLLKG
jgi:hypothetical protein